jgi:hypothetical protein
VVLVLQPYQIVTDCNTKIDVNKYTTSYTDFVLYYYFWQLVLALQPYQIATLCMVQIVIIVLYVLTSVMCMPTI